MSGPLKKTSTFLKILLRITTLEQNLFISYVINKILNIILKYKYLVN